jgi:DNA mismatch repair protein MutS2
VRLREEVQAREAAIDRREREAERRTRQQARDILLRAREEVDTTIRELRAAVEAAADAAGREEAFHRARRTVEARAQRQLERTPHEAGMASSDAATLEVGARVRISASGASGRIVEVRDGRAVVETSGGVRLQVPTADLTADAAPEREAKRPRGGGWSMPDFEPASEIDLRGMRADEVETTLPPALDAAIQAALPSFRIIHGKGTGALREVVTQLLRSDPRIGGFRAGGTGEGGTGVTIVELS